MKKVLLSVLAMTVLVGCAPRQVTTITPIVTADGKFARIIGCTSRDRFGTEVVSQYWQDEDGRELARFSGSGPGVGTVAMQGAVAGLEQAGGIIGAGALIRPANYSGGNSSATGGKSSSKSSAKTYQSQAQGQSQKQVQGQVQGQNQTLRNTNTNSNINTNLNTNSNHNVNTALGGAGGAGGAGGSVVNSGNNVGTSSINAGSGGIGNIDATGNSVVNTGQGMINTGNNATVTGPLTQN